MTKTELRLKEFIKGYIICALWSSTGDDDKPLDDTFGPEDMSEEAMERVVKDCVDFIAGYSSLMLDTEANSEQHGHDFWLTRNGHGVGFWDRDYGEVGNQLSAACRQYGECWLYVGDDRKLYFL